MASISSKSGLSIKAKLDEEEEKFKLEKNHVNEETYELNDLIGPFGFYQILVMIFACLREAITSYDSVGPALALPMDDTFVCKINETTQEHLQTTEAGYDPKCYFIERANRTILPCTEWEFQDKFKDTMLVEWQLVCEKEYLASMVHSSFYVGYLLGILIWGPLADMIGRWKSYALCHMAYLIFNAAAVFAPNVYWFMGLRFLAGFHAIGYFVLYTLQIEMIGINYRSFSNTLNHAGWGLGVLLVPFIGHFVQEWRYLIAVVPIANALLLPWMMILPESIRWMIMNNKFAPAKKEIKRGAKLNRLQISNLDEKIDKFIESKKVEQINSPSTPTASFTDLFTNKSLCRGLISLCCVYATLMYIYYSRTLHFAPDEASMFANFIITGSGEWLSLFISAMCMYYMARKKCLVMFVGITAASMTFEALTHFTIEEVPPVLNYVTDAFIKVFALSAVMVTFLVMLETFPTILRQSGNTIVITAGGVAIVIAPFHIEFEEVISSLGHTILIAVILILLAFAIKYCLKETGKTDLLDSISVVQNSPPLKDQKLGINNNTKTIQG